ncbi:MAG: hypothetical protein QOG22_2812, partial [Pseudonocardiales bacterium]|nr:hypothetical protein [Pseudonocardiales bacterium]
MAARLDAFDQAGSEIDEAGLRDRANLVVGGFDFAPSFSVWTRPANTARRGAAGTRHLTRVGSASDTVHAMPRYGAQFGPDLTFLGVDRCDW